MKLGELLQEAIQIKAYGLQSLIMFVVFEKQVLSLEDDKQELDLYFKPQHTKRMNQLLIDYQKKLGMQHEPLFYWMTTEEGNYIVKAESEEQARLFTNQAVGPINDSSYLEAETELVQLDAKQQIKARYRLGPFAEKMPVPAVVGRF